MLEIRLKLIEDLKLEEIIFINYLAIEVASTHSCHSSSLAQ